MILIKALKGPNGFSKVEIGGHAGYDDIGYDIVCAAVSALSQAIALGIEKAQSTSRVVIDERSAALAIHIGARMDEDPREFEDAQLLLTTLITGLEDIAAQYPKHVKLQLKTEGK